MTPESCCDCGACCFSVDDRHVLVRQDDYDRLGPRAEELTHARSGLCFMRMENGHCVALAITADDRFACSIYPDRPEICRELERGSSPCAKEREQKRASAEHALAYDVPLRKLHARVHA